MKLSTWGHWSRQPLAIAGVLGVLLFAQIAATRVSAADLWRWANPKPKAPHQPECPPNMINLAKKVTKLEDQVRRNGSITIKQPDVWGESNLMSYIQEYEDEMNESIDKFRETIQGYTLNSDSAKLASSTAVGAGDAMDSTIFAATQTAASNAANQPNANSNPVPLSGLTALVTQIKPTSVGATGTATTPFGLEPTELERQHSVYVQMNQALRRTNMGDDNSRAAGNSLYMLRFPVSVLPGRETYEGYSAVITLRAHLVIGETHLRYTYPKLVVTDTVNGVIPILFQYWNEESISLLPKSAADPRVSSQVTESFSDRGMERFVINAQSPGSNQQLIKQYGECELTALLKFVRSQFNEKPKVEELRAFLFSQFLNLYEQLIVGGMFSPRDDQTLSDLAQIGSALAVGNCNALDISRQRWQTFVSGIPLNCDENSKSFSWILALNAAALDANIMRLIEARQRSGSETIATMDSDPFLHFYVVNGPSQGELNAKWAELIEAEFPVHVFALNPMVEEQNVYDAFSRSRDLQIAFAMAVANGNMRAGQAMRFSRQVSLEMAAIGLNRTAVAFAHENDTFGWYFHPRVQSPPPERSNVAALGRLLWSGGPTERYDQRHEKLDPGIRECEAVIVMPAFVPGVRFDVITNWEKRCKPGAVKRDYAEMLVEGAEILSTLNYAANVSDQACYRPVDYEVLVSRVEQIEKMLPLQSVNVRLPYQHEVAGSELFDGGQSQLKPRLDGFYGLTYVAGTDKSEMFLTGAHFHPVLTRVILGGREADEVKIMSRELLKVRFKEVAKALTIDPVEVRVATPAGISSPLRIQMTPPAATSTSGFAWETAMPLQGSFDSTVSPPQIDGLRPSAVVVKVQGYPNVMSPRIGELWLVPKFLKQDGVELKPDQGGSLQVKNGASNTFTFAGGKFSVPIAEFKNALNQRLGVQRNPFALGLPSLKVTADAYLVLDNGGLPVKIDGPVVIDLTAKPCDCPATEAASVPMPDLAPLAPFGVSPAAEPAPDFSEEATQPLPAPGPGPYYDPPSEPMPMQDANPFGGQPVETVPTPAPRSPQSSLRLLRPALGNRPSAMSRRLPKVEPWTVPDSSRVQQAGAVVR